MKAKYILSGLLLSMAVTACADHHGPRIPDGPHHHPKPVAPFALSGSVSIRQRIALPTDAVLTIRLSDAASGPGATRVLAQQIQRLNGKQSPFHYVLPLKDVHLAVNSHAFLSAAVTINGRVIFSSEALHPVKLIDTQPLDLTLIPVPEVAVPLAGQ